MRNLDDFFWMQEEEARRHPGLFPVQIPLEWRRRVWRSLRQNMENRQKLVGVGLGAGLLGAAFLTLKYAIRPPTKSRVPDAISPAIFATKVLHTSLGAMVYHESGAGVPLVFIHSVGLGSSSYEWSKVYPGFATNHRVLAPDLIGFGESARPSGKMTPAEQSRTIAEFLRATCDEPAILVGSGLGGAFCVLVASQHPELVSRLVLLMPTGLAEFGHQRLPLPTRMLGRTRVLNRFLYRNHLATRSGQRTLLERHGFANPANVTEEAIDVFTTCAQQAGAEHAMLNLLSGRLSFDLEPRMKSLTQPVTLLWGEKVSFPPLEWAFRWQAMLERSRLVTLPNVAAMAALEDPETIIRELGAELSGELRVA